MRAVVLPLNYLLIAWALLVIPHFAPESIGLPLNQIFELTCAMIFLLNSVVYLGSRLGWLELTPKPSRGIFLLLGILTLNVLAFASYFFFELPAFSRCYANNTQAEKCWFSANQVFFPDKVTDYTDQLEWDGSLKTNLWYKNDLSLVNQTDARVTYKGKLLPGTNPVRLTYQGQIQLQIGEVNLTRESAKEQTELLTLSGKDFTPVKISVPIGEGNRFKLENELGQKWTVIKAKDDSPFVIRAVRKTAFVFTFISLSVLFLLFANQFMRLLQWESAIVLAGVISILLTHFYSPLLGLRFLLPGIFLATLFSQKKTLPISTVSLVLFLGVAIFATKFTQFSPLMFRQIGDDPLTHETMSRTILMERSLRGGEDTFFYQPGFRYYQSFCFLLFGENNTTTLTLNLFLLFYSAWFLFAALDRRVDSGKLSRVVAFFALLIVSGPGSYNAIANLSEFVNWIFVLVAAGFMVSGQLFYCIPFCLGYAALVRPNQMPGLFAFTFAWLVWHYMRENRHSLFPIPKKALIALFAFTSMQFLPMLHNWYFGHKFAFLPASALDKKALVYTLPPSELIHVFSSASVRANLMFQLRHMGVFGALSTPLHWTNRIAFNFIGLAFVAIIFLLWRKTKSLLAFVPVVAAFPFFFIHLFVDTSNYFPRHQIGPYLILALMCVVSRSFLKESSR